jgi:hypothetical protein
VLPIFLSIGLMGWIKGLKCLLGWRRLPLFDRFGYVEMMLFLIQKISLITVQYFASFMVIASGYEEP